MSLQLRFAMHMRLQHGSTIAHEILEEETGKVVGYRSSFTPRGKHRDKHPPKTVYRLGFREFETSREFMQAYNEEKKANE